MLQDRIEKFRHLQSRIEDVLLEGDDKSVAGLDQQLTECLDSILAYSASNPPESRQKVVFMLELLVTELDRTKTIDALVDLVLAEFDKKFEKVS